MSVIKKTINAMINIENKPRDKMLKGKEIIDKIGFRILKPIARISPPIKRVLKPSCKISPSNNNWVIYSANA